MRAGESFVLYIHWALDYHVSREREGCAGKKVGTMFYEKMPCRWCEGRAMEDENVADRGVRIHMQGRVC